MGVPEGLLHQICMEGNVQESLCLVWGSSYVLHVFIISLRVNMTSPHSSEDFYENMSNSLSLWLKMVQQHLSQTLDPTHSKLKTEGLAS